MTREQARPEARSRWREVITTMTTPAKRRVEGETTYICPICGHGKNGDGIKRNPTSPDGNGLKCFGCDFSGDIFDLYKAVNHCTDIEAFNAIYGLLGLQVENDTATPAPRPQRPAPAAQKPQEVQGVQQAQEEQGAPLVYDYQGYYQTVARPQLDHPDAVAYLSKRGISMELARRFWLGYDPAWRSPTALRNGKNPPESPRLIIPTGPYSYVARDIRPGVKDFAKMKEGAAQPFNLRALGKGNHDRRPVFVVEGEIDALSIMEAGAEAVALGSTSNTRKLLDHLRDHPTTSTMILCLDNDDAGKKASAELADGLQGLNIDYVTADISGGHKDPNEALQADRTTFFKAVEDAQHNASSKPDAVTDYINRLLAGEIDRFKQGANRRTGFDNLDAVAGGIYPGLYVLGAISSLGKTTFIHQLADQMAAAGENVLYFSLEQSRLEMVSKSLARITAQMSTTAAVTSLQIRAGHIDDAVLDAIDEYRGTIGDRMSVIEGNFNCTVSFIGDYITRYMERNKVKPIVIIDYLQIIQGDARQRQSTKELIDSNVTELKRISRSRDIPIFLISSLNRSNYLTPIDFESFKESGGIEYTADVIWGLQLQAINDDVFSKENKIKEKRERIREAKAETPRRIELVCLKNRYGISSYKAAFDYYPQYDLFKPAELDDFDTGSRPAKRY